MPRRADRSNSVDRRDAEATQRAGDMPTPWVGRWQCWLSNGLVGQRRGRRRLITRHTREALWRPHARPIRIHTPNSRVQQRNNTHDPKTAAAARVAAWGTDGCRQRPYTVAPPWWITHEAIVTWTFAVTLSFVTEIAYRAAGACSE